MDQQSTISAIRSILLNYNHESDGSFGCDFAIKRFHKKLEIPDLSKKSELKEACFQQFIDFDKGLAKPFTLTGKWYRARILLHQMVHGFKLSELVFTNGSEVEPTRGHNSIESKLMRSKWSCTVDCFDLWAETAWGCRAVKSATRRRFRSLILHTGKDLRKVEKEIWSRVRSHKDPAFLSFKYKLSLVTRRVDGSRFSSVRKDNTKDRPIDLQPLCNMLVQRRIGNGIRETLKRFFGIDLNTLAEKHKCLIVDPAYATLDLKNASDSVTVKLCEFLFPKWFFKLLMESRTYMTLGLDGHYHVLNKISSMGNGFTFELMSLILHAVGVQYDGGFSVFGDDIIIRNEFATDLIKDLESAYFIVNKEKSFISSPFRESCGGNYLDGYGYIESYDFEYPVTLLDCAAIHNKCYLLGKHYPTFKRLYALLHRVTPPALRGPIPSITKGLYGRARYESDLKVDYFWTEKFRGIDLKISNVSSYLKASWQYDDCKFGHQIVADVQVASPRRRNIIMRRHTGKYFMYLFSGMITDDVLTNSVTCSTPLFIYFGQNCNSLKSIKTLIKRESSSPG